MTKNFLSLFPSPEVLLNNGENAGSAVILEANGHIHTPFSFSSFSDLEEIFRMAENENIKVLGINDFYVTDGYQTFYEGCMAAGIFPLFNIEFIGLMKEEQKKGIRINDPNNPGRIYFTGKGLDYPFHVGTGNFKILEAVKQETQNQLQLMVDKLNGMISNVNPYLSLDFNDIRKRYARDLVRERHIARAIRFLTAESYYNPSEQIAFIESLYGNRKSKAGMDNPAALENDIRSNLLKTGGAAFVAEDENSFLEIRKIIEIIKDAGGIPCYPVLLDDPSGKCTEFESDREKLRETLSALGVGCIELIPGRNDHDLLEEFVGYFDNNGFIITLGTEHNTPEMMPLTVSARGGRVLSNRLKRVNMRGVSIIAAHQYLRARNMEGFTGANERSGIAELEKLEKTGRRILEYYLTGK